MNSCFALNYLIHIRSLGQENRHKFNSERTLQKNDSQRKDSTSGRMMWIDWMKSIGIYLIVTGHFFPIGCKYVYAFSVPLFFLISGILTKDEENSEIFWKKLWFNMCVPMLIICTINKLIGSVISSQGLEAVVTNLIHYPVWLILGFHKALGCLWFVYTLICLKIIVHFTAHNRTLALCLLICIPAVGIYIDAHPIFFGRNVVAMSNAIIDTTMAYPYFWLGYYLRRYKVWLNQRSNITKEILVLIIVMLIFGVGATVNGLVWMYRNGYGNNFGLFLLDGICGTVAVFIVSKWMGNYFSNAVITISKGTIIILGFHQYFISLANKMLPSIPGIGYFYAAIITLLFIPVIIFISKHIPILIGKYRVAHL